MDSDSAIVLQYSSLPCDESLSSKQGRRKLHTSCSSLEPNDSVANILQLLMERTKLVLQNVNRIGLMTSVLWYIDNQKVNFLWSLIDVRN